MNSIVISGNVGQVNVSTHGERKVIKASVAVNNSVYADGQWKNETTWFNVEYWVNVKSNIDTRIQKGVGVIVHGKMVSHRHDEKIYWTLKADNVETTFSGKSPEGNSTPMPSEPIY